MSSYLERFFRLGFDGLFVSYEASWLSLAAELSREAHELIASDLGVKYPALAQTAEPLDTKLAAALDTDATLQAALIYRISHALFRRDPQHAALKFFAHFMRVRTAMELYYSTEIGPRLRIMHGTGVVLGPRNQIGSDFTIYQGVTLGQRRQFSSHETMTIGDRVSIFAGAKVLGALRIGDDVKVAANAVLLSDAEAGATYAGSPARKVVRA